MEFFVLEIITNTATFRNPEFQNFHKTLPLPPPTTIVGLAGAAMGLSPKSAQDFFVNNSFKYGVFGKSVGKAKDTWKYQKPLKGRELYNYRPEYGSVITKEILFGNRFFIVFGSDNANAVEKLISSFENPRYALTMGNSDSLAFIKNINKIESLTESKTIRNCIVEGNVVDEVLSNPNKDLVFSIYQTAEPIAYDLPVRFNYESDYGKRTVSEIKTFSFVTAEMVLNFNIEGIYYNDLFIPICDL